MSDIRNRRQQATWWPTSPGTFQGFSFGAPKVLQCRWEDIATQFRTQDGEEVTSAAVVYLGRDVEVGDYLMLGDFSDVPDPSTLAGAYRVRQFSKVSNLRNISVERRAYL